VFSLARRMSPCIVFLDEVDSLFGARSSQSSGGAQAHRQILTGRWREVRMKETCADLLETEFMQEMDGLSSASKNREQRIVVIGATNRPYVSFPASTESNCSYVSYRTWMKLSFDDCLEGYWSTCLGKRKGRPSCGFS
jgi:SpoVK/Ycf46/Vps4 family AAA+-type ATPase